MGTSSPIFGFGDFLAIVLNLSSLIVLLGGVLMKIGGIIIAGYVSLSA